MVSLASRISIAAVSKWRAIACRLRPLLYRPELVLANQTTVGGGRGNQRPRRRDALRALRRAKVIREARFILRFLLSLIKRQEMNDGRQPPSDVTE
jgi:hypothetical protein